MKSVRALLLLVTAAHGTIAQENHAVAPETLHGRPVAEVNSFLFGSGLSHKWMSFYFASEEADGTVKPIQIAYAFYRSDQLPPESFWDYSKLYEIKVRRERGCDTKVENLAYVKNTTQDGKELPRSFVLRFAKDAPKDLLKDEAVLPCYVLWYGDYRQVSAQNGGSRNSVGQSGLPDECARTAQMDVYSDAQVSSVTGDLSGFDLALGKPNGSRRKALLFVYEGGGSEGIPLSATADGNNLVIEGTWVEHATEYPSKKDIVQTHRVRITGKLTPKIIRGTISIEGLEIVNPESMQLKRVKQIWACKAHSSE